jgi:HSP20 family molecular chaperone IbpA
LLPESVEVDQIKAKYQDGILKLAIPKKPEAKKLEKKKIAIN